MKSVGEMRCLDVASRARGTQRQDAGTGAEQPKIQSGGEPFAPMGEKADRSTSENKKAVLWVGEGGKLVRAEKCKKGCAGGTCARWGRGEAQGA